MYYIEKGLGTFGKPLAVFFAVLLGIRQLIRRAAARALES